MLKKRCSRLNALKTFVVQNDVVGVQSALTDEPWMVNHLVVHNNVDYYSFLCIAAERGFAGIAKVLIQHAADVNQQSLGGQTPLILAATNGHDDVVRLLLQQPEIVVNLCDDLRQTALFHATAHKHHSVVKQLTDAGGNISSDTSCQTSRTDLLKNLKTAVQVNCAAKARSVLKRDNWLVNRLVFEQPSPRCFKKPFSFLHLAAEHGFVDVAKLLLQANANVNQYCVDGSTPLFVAASRNKAAMVALLLEQPGIIVDVMNDSGLTPLHEAAYQRSTDSARLLLAANANIEATDGIGNTPLLMAACGRGESIGTPAEHRATMQLLLQHKADVNCHTEHFSCLHLLASFGCDAEVALLLAADAAPDVANQDGVTPLMAALDFGSAPTIDALLAAGATVQAGSKALELTLFKAAIKGHIDIVKRLLQLGGYPCLSVEADSAVDETEREAYQGVAMLLAAKADHNAAFAHSNAPLTLAIESNCARVAKLLLERGANVCRPSYYSNKQLARGQSAEIQALFADGTECAVQNAEKSTAC